MPPVQSGVSICVSDYEMLGCGVRVRFICVCGEQGEPCTVHLAYSVYIYNYLCLLWSVILHH